VSALYIGAYWVAVTVFTRLCPPSSARFPWLNHRSRSLSPPVELSGEPWQRGTARPAFTITSTVADYRCNAPQPSWDSPGMRKPPWVLAVAETRPRGPTGRVGAGLCARASPEMRPGSHHDDWAATPQSGAQSLRKTPESSCLVARSHKIFG
jgi:hypothetical protein